jgi:hypothetical protein
MKRSAIAVFFALLTNPAAAQTVSFKCSFGDGQMDDLEVLYVVNSAAKEVTVIGGFGTHPAKLLSYTGDFYYVLEPNNGASVSTIIYISAGETPVATRTTLGLISQEQYKGIPESYRLAAGSLRFMAIGLKGKCPVQR